MAMATGSCCLPRSRNDRRGTAAMEFAMVAPIMVVLIWGVWDVARALVAWEETYHAAEAIAQAAEKMSITNVNYPNTTKPVTALTASQMQDAMSSIYAEMPWLSLGNGTGAFRGQYAVTLSGVAFTPLCPATSSGVCAAQTPNVLWSTYLVQGGSQLLNPPPNNPATPWRLCGPLKAVAQFPNNNTQLTVMIDPNQVQLVNPSINDIPQVVADVRFTYTPTFPLLSKYTYTFYASATFPAPLGGDDQEIVFDLKDTTNYLAYVENCNGGNAYTGN
jgi:Flp pilus assembly protein TadG